MTLDELISRTLLLDVETTKSGKIREIGAILDGRVVLATAGASVGETLSQVDDLSSGADYVLGHNLLGHDFPILKAAYPRLAVLGKPVIDTLYLSPLAFPQNPYHRLVKDYKLVRSSVSDPVADARLAASVFRDQWESFRGSGAGLSHPIDFYRFCFEASLFNGFSGEGLAAVFAAVEAKGFVSPKAALEFLVEATAGGVCQQAVVETAARMLEDPIRRPALAYCLAWLQVAGTNSVLPPWVRYRFPEIAAVLTRLRQTPCGGDGCSYCREHHHPELNLERFFGFTGFREKPTTSDGQSLQRTIVLDGMRGRPLLAILPTGGGKSVCYQLPALVRHRCRGLMTVVISPLVALMKDQVDNLIKVTGTPFAAAISGLQTPPERGEVLERVRLGDVAILYIAPEQLRSRSVRTVLSQREIGCWVFDEAHCVSVWGHDFRPDYLYAARFIREFAAEFGQPVPPVACFTATAKSDVIEDITSHFRNELGQELRLFAGGIERENLSFEVLPVGAAEKLERTFEILSESFREDAAGSAIVYAETRAKTEEIRDFLRHQGMAAEAFHGGLDAKEKRDIIDASNQLIRRNLDRMKTEHPIRINRERAPNSPGGRWELLDPVSKGRVQVVAIRNRRHQAECVKSELERLRGLLPDLDWADCAILARSRKDLAPVRSVLEEAGLPVRVPLETSLPLHRVREFAAFIKALSDQKAENRKASELLGMLDDLSSNSRVSPWWQMLEGFVRALVDETADAVLPVGWAIDSLYDFIAEQRREKSLGSGIFLGTIHSTKGLEFAHVIILDGGWPSPSDPARIEEERRTLYVGMTRARETLSLMKLAERPNLFLKGLKGECFLHRKLSADAGREEESAFRQYEVLGLSDIYLDYAGGFPKSHAIHAHLARIQAGEKAFLAAEDVSVKICDQDGFCVGRLSQSASNRWKDKLDRISEVRVVAMIERDRMDPQEDFRDRIKAEKWEAPVLEMVFSGTD
jgi:hypothetical protein